MLARVVEIDDVHRAGEVRLCRSGRFTHVDAHLVVPEFWSVEQAHDFGNAFERRVMRSLDLDGEIAFHIDPCHREFCSGCDVDPCPIRLTPYTGRTWIPLEEAVRPDAAEP